MNPNRFFETREPPVSPVTVKEAYSFFWAKIHAAPTEKKPKSTVTRNTNELLPRGACVASTVATVPNDTSGRVAHVT